MSSTGTLGDGLRLLAARLPTIIQQTLNPIIPDVEWTTVLKEVDRRKGRLRETPGAYEPGDLQTQLRILTEPLASLGHPFDDHTRTVSILAGELRSVRNSWAHTYDFSALQAFRALDSVTRLLKHFADHDGQRRGEALRNSLIPALLDELGIGAHQAEDSQPTPQEAETPEDTDPESARALEAASRSTQIDPSEDSAETQIAELGRSRVPFEPWTVVKLGPAEVFESLRSRSNAELVRAAAEEIIDVEGPIHPDRLVRLILRSFNRKQATPKIKEQILRQAKNTGLHRDADGFYWPRDLTPDTWEEFRPSMEKSRDFEEISPVELRNAAHQIQHHTTEELTQDELERALLRAFGFRRRTQRVQKHLTATFKDSL